MEGLYNSGCSTAADGFRALWLQLTHVVVPFFFPSSKERAWCVTPDISTPPQVLAMEGLHSSGPSTAADVFLCSVAAADPGGGCGVLAES